MGIIRKIFRELAPYSFKKIIGGLISNNVTGYFFSKVYRDRIPFYGVSVNTNHKRILRKVVSDLVFKIYERAEIEQVRLHLKGDVDVVELGGSIGVNTMQIRKKLQDGIRLVTVEADPSLVPILSQNLRDNGLDSRVHVVNTAIDYSGKSSTFFSVSESTLSGRVGEKGGIKIDTSTLASLLKRFSIEKFTLVSDIEGMEIPIFIEDVKSLKNCMQIFLEIDGYSYKGINYSVDDIICMVEKIGFSVVIRYHNCVVFEKL